MVSRGDIGDLILGANGQPNARQREFFASRARYTAYGGARGGGKSWALRRKLVAMCLRWPGLRAMLVRRSYGELKGNHLGPMLEEYGAVCRWGEGEKTLFFPEGSRIRFAYCDGEGDVLRYQGQEYDIIAIDEATQLSEMQFAAFRACLRGTSDRPRRMYLTCNPGGIGHAWVKRLFVDRDFRVGENPQDYRFIPAQVYDNRALLNADPDYVRQLESLPQRLRDAWLHGRWDVFEGQFFPEFCTERHICRALSPPADWRCFAALDYGFDMLAVLLFAVDYDGGLWVLREHCQSGLSLGEAGRAIVGFLGEEGGRVEYIAASPDLWNRRQDSGRSGVEILSAVERMPPLLRADNRRVAGWRVVREYLAKSEGGMHIASTCTTLISSLSALRFDPVRTEDAADHPHEITHAPEALRYGVMSCLPAPTREEFSFASAERLHYWH
ncbi:MAG: phage terminase large subunit [Clostridia bacterium]|nr:phage terminase large subunit [Clostridia bacterium]